MIVMLWILLVVAALLWVSHVVVFWCEWGRGTIDRAGGLKATFWCYTTPALIAVLWLALGIAFVGGEVHYAYLTLAMPLGLMILSVIIQVPAYRRLIVAERQHQQDVAERMPQVGMMSHHS